MMKKIILFLGLALCFTSCSNNDDISDNIEQETYLDLSNAAISPANYTVLAGSDINYLITKNNKVLNNKLYQWSLSNFNLWDNPNNEDPGSFHAKLIGNFEISVNDGKGNFLKANLEVKPNITYFPVIPYFRKNGTKNEIKSNVTWSLEHENIDSLVFRTGDYRMTYYFTNSSNTLKFIRLTKIDSQIDFKETNIRKYNDERFSMHNTNSWNAINPLDGNTYYIVFGEESANGNSYYYNQFDL